MMSKEENMLVRALLLICKWRETQIAFHQMSVRALPDATLHILSLGILVRHIKSSDDGIHSVRWEAF